MLSLRKNLALVSLITLLGMAPAAHAQWAVVDVGAIAQLIKQVATLEQQLRTAQSQLQQAQQQYQSMTGGRGMEQLLSGTVRNYLPSDWQTLAAAAQGISGYGPLSAQVNAVLQGNAILTPAQIALLSDQERAQLNGARGSAALLQVTTRQALSNSSSRFAALQQLNNAIPAATDAKAILDLQARIAVEQAMLQNENTKLMVLYQAAHAEELAREQRARELAITNVGSLRRLGPIGLNN